MKRKKCLTIHIRLLLFALLVSVSLPSTHIRYEKDDVKQIKPAIVNSSSVNTNTIDYKKIDNTNVRTVKVDINYGVRSTYTYIITVFALYFLLNTPPPYPDKILYLINIVYFNVGKYKKHADTF